MTKPKTLRLTYPQWQGGVNPNYLFGAELLSAIAPSSPTDESVKIQVNNDFDGPRIKLDGIDCGSDLLSQMGRTAEILREKQPDRVIVFGGDCSVTQVPFDYLSGKYGDKLGILWLDAHPDISSPDNSSHLHEMPLSNLLGLNPGSPLTRVEYPVSPKKVCMAGLIEEELRQKDIACREQKLKIVSPEELAQSSHAVLDWIKEQDIQYIAVHWDLDVLSPEDFRSIYPAEPYLNPGMFSAAIGRMKLQEVGRLLCDVSKTAEIVGLSLTEYLPWDAFNLRKILSGITIFN